MSEDRKPGTNTNLVDPTESVQINIFANSIAGGLELVALKHDGATVGMYVDASGPYVGLKNDGDVLPTAYTRDFIQLAARQEEEAKVITLDDLYSTVKFVKEFRERLTKFATFETGPSELIPPPQ